MSTDAMKAIASKLKTKREWFGYSQKELAMLAGVNDQAVQRIEAGGANPTIDTVSKLLKALGCELSVIDGSSLADALTREVSLSDLTDKCFKRSMIPFSVIYESNKATRQLSASVLGGLANRGGCVAIMDKTEMQARELLDRTGFNSPYDLSSHSDVEKNYSRWLQHLYTRQGVLLGPEDNVAPGVDGTTALAGELTNVYISKIAEDISVGYVDKHNGYVDISEDYADKSLNVDNLWEMMSGLFQFWMPRLLAEDYGFVDAVAFCERKMADEDYGKWIEHSIADALAAMPIDDVDFSSNQFFNADLQVYALTDTSENSAFSTTVLTRFLLSQIKYDSLTSTECYDGHAKSLVVMAGNDLTRLRNRNVMDNRAWTDSNSDLIPLIRTSRSLGIPIVFCYDTSDYLADNDWYKINSLTECASFVAYGALDERKTEIACKRLGVPATSDNKNVLMDAGDIGIWCKSKIISDDPVIPRWINKHDEHEVEGDTARGVKPEGDREDCTVTSFYGAHGSGKTTVSVMMASKMASMGRKVCVLGVYGKNFAQEEGWEEAMNCVLGVYGKNSKQTLGRAMGVESLARRQNHVMILDDDERKTQLEMIDSNVIHSFSANADLLLSEADELAGDHLGQARERLKTIISRLRKYYDDVIVDFDDEALRILDGSDGLVDVIVPCLRVIDAGNESQDREKLETRLKVFKLTEIAPWVIMEKDAEGKPVGKTGEVVGEIKLPIADNLSLSSFENRIGKAIKNGVFAKRFDDGLGKLLKSIDEILLKAATTKKD